MRFKSAEAYREANLAGNKDLKDGKDEKQGPQVQGYKLQDIELQRFIKNFYLLVILQNLKIQVPNSIQAVTYDNFTKFISSRNHRVHEKVETSWRNKQFLLSTINLSSFCFPRLLPDEDHGQSYQFRGVSRRQRGVGTLSSPRLPLSKDSCYRRLFKKITSTPK